MAEHVITEAHKALVEGQNSATESWPSELEARQKLVRAFFIKQDEEKAAVKKAQDEAKAKVGAGDMQKRLMKDYGWKKLALNVLGSLRKLTDPMERAATSRQIYEGMKDEGFLIPELFDLGRAGAFEGAADEAKDTPIFDNTPKGSKTKGVGKGVVETAAAAQVQAQTGTGPGLDLNEALAKLEAYRAANPPKPGAKKKELKELEAAVEAARVAAPALPEVNQDAPGDDELPELPAADGPIAPEIKAGVDQSAAHIADQVEGTIPEPKKRTSKPKKGQEGMPLPDLKTETKPAVAGPDGPDDDEENPFAPVPQLPRTLGGGAANTTRLG